MEAETGPAMGKESTGWTGTEQPASQGGTGWSPGHEAEALSPAQARLRRRSNWKTWAGARAPRHQDTRAHASDPFIGNQNRHPRAHELRLAQVPCKINRYQDGNIRMSSHPLPLPTFPAPLSAYQNRCILYYRKRPPWKSEASGLLGHIKC